MEISGIEALILISLHNMREDSPLLTRMQIEDLRDFIHESVEKGSEVKERKLKVDFSISQLLAAEKKLPLYGVINEALYGPFRIRLSESIRISELTELCEKVKNKMESTKHGNSESSSNTTDNTIRRPRGRPRKKAES